MAKQLARPVKCDEKHLRSLDVIREMGIVNMWGGAEPLRQVYPELSEAQAAEILIYWMETFSDRHPQQGVER